MPAKKKLTFILVVAVLLLSACNLPSAQKTPQAVYTEAAMTVQAGLTLSALSNPSMTPLPLPATQTATPPPPTNAPSPMASATPICDLASFVTDVTIPDGTQLVPGQTFVKTWRMQNYGACTWNSGYQLIFDSGALMDGPSPQALAGSVGPNQIVDISVTLKAPTAPGPYRGYWRLRNQAGVLIPVVNGHEGMSFFVDVKVVPLTSTPTATVPPSLTPTASTTATVTPTPTGTP